MGWRPYLGENESNREFKDYLSNLLEGKSIVPRQYFHPKSMNKPILSKLTAGRIIFKFCRFNLLLPWFVNAFKGSKPIFFWRDPLSVVASQIEFGNRTGGPYKKIHHLDLTSYSFADLNTRTPLREIIKTVRTQEEHLAFWWCYSNFLGFMHSRAGEAWISLNYGDLYRSPNSELERLFSELKIEYSSRYMRLINQNSGTVISRTSDRTEKYKLILSKIQQENVVRIVNSFGLSKFLTKVQ